MSLSHYFTRLRRSRLTSCTTRRPKPYTRRLNLEHLEDRVVPSTWASVSATNPASGPTNTQTLMLLSDGTVMIEFANPQVNKTWYKYTPSSSGSYVNGTWSSLAPMNEGRAFFPTAILPDGRVFAVGGEYTSPDSFSNTAEIFDPTIGATGKWTSVTSAPTPDSKFGDDPIEVLPNGQILAGYYNSGLTYLYNPVTDTWSNKSASITGASNASPIVINTPSTAGLANGETVILSGVGGNTAANNTFTIAGLTATSFNLVGSTGNGAYTGGGTWAASKVRGDRSDEESWVKLPDNSILSYDIFGSEGVAPTPTFKAQRYIPSQNRWVDASNLSGANPPGLLSTSAVGQEMGPAFLLPSGLLPDGRQVIVFGGNGNTAYYNPSTDIWSAGPAEPTRVIGGVNTQLVMSDAPGAMLPNGHILLALSPLGALNPAGGYTFPAPTFMYELDPTTGIYTDVTPAAGLPANSDFYYMLVLPTGQVMMTGNNLNPILIYTPDGGPQDAWRPAISTITKNNNNDAYTLTGTQLNGISEGANFGDEMEMATNFPIIELRDGDGNVSYARTSNWTSTGVATGTTPESTQFSLPAGKSLGDYYTVTVIANGIRSAPDVFGVGAHVALPEFSDRSPAIGTVNNLAYITWRGRDNHFLNVMQLFDDGSADEATKYVSGATVNGSPSLATVGNQMYVAWTGDDNNLYVSTVNITGNTIFVPPPIMLNETSDQSPALAAFNGQLYIAWTGQGNNFLNVMRLNGNLTGVEPHYVSGATVAGFPALTASNGQFYVSITGESESLYVSTVVVNGPIVNGTDISVPPFPTLPETSNFSPALGSYNGKPFIGWTGQGQNYLNVMQLNADGSPVEPHPVRQGETASSAVALDSNNGRPLIAWTGTDGAGTLYTAPVAFFTAAPGASIQNGGLVVNAGPGDNSIGIKRVDPNTIEVSLNGQATDYSAGSLSEITINTSTGTNTINVLSTIAGLPVTVNTGAGTNTVNVAPTSQNVTDLAGPLTINGVLGGNTAVVVYDQLDPFDETFTLTSSTLASTHSATITYQNLQGLILKAGAGNDTLVVDSTKGLVTFPNGVNYDGGGGFNALQLVQTGGVAQTSDDYSPGPQPGQGVSTIIGAAGTQTIGFQNLAPVVDTVAAANLTVHGTPANNAINYSVGSATSRGLVSVDNFETIEFANKTGLAIDSGAGVDTVSLNNPNTPASLTAISVTGGDPTSLDTLIVNGVAASVGVNTATGVITGATGNSGTVPITYDTFESLIVNAGSSTSLAVSGSTGYIYTPGSSPDAGTVQTDSVPISFTGLGSGRTLALTGSGGSLAVNGTAGNDTFAVAATSGNVAFSGRATIAPTAIASLTINGLGGSDTFSVTGPQSYTSIVLASGGPAASQIANLTGNGTAVTANLGGTATSVTGGGLGNVFLPGIGVLNLGAAAGAILLEGTSGPDAFTVSPTSADTTTAQIAALAQVVNTTNTSSLTVDGGGGSDTLAINGSSGADTIAVNGSSVSVNALKVVAYTNIAALQVNGLAGSDTFQVTSSATVPFSIDGGDPVGVLPGDLLDIVTSLNDMANFTGGPTSDSGGFQVNSNQPISFVHIESLSLSGGGTPIINGTNGNDVITIIARDSSYAGGADGVQDFTVSVNAGPSFLFLNTSSLIVHALAGDDLIVLHAPAPNLANWAVNLTMDGGPASSIGDQLRVETPGVNQATFTPTSTNSGTFAVANVSTSIQIGDIESFVYDGQSGGDSLTVIGTAGADAVAVNPGATNDSGTVAVNSLLAALFQNLGSGAGAKVVVDGNGGADALTYNGTAANDSFSVKSNGTGGEVDLNARVPLVTANIATMTLEGLAGDDSFTLAPTIANSPYTTLNLNGGGQASAAGDQATLTAAASALINVSGQTVSQSGKTVAGGGLESIKLNGAGNHLTYTGVAGVTEAITIAASPTANQGQISVPNVVLLTFTNVPGFDAVGNPADNDTLTFAGTSNDDSFQVNLAAAGTTADPVLKLQTSAASLLLTLTNYTGFTTLGMAGLDGSDTFNVFVAAAGPAGGRHIFIDGGTDTGKKKGTDVLNVFYATPRPKIVHSTATQNPTSGLVSLYYGAFFFLIEYAGVENYTIHQQ
jgi:hypothetical protein